MSTSKERSVKWQTFQNKYLTPKYVTKWLWSIVRAVIIAGLCYIILFPFFEKIINAFKSYEDLIDPTVKFLPKHFTLENVSRTVQKMQYSFYCCGISANFYFCFGRIRFCKI